MAIDEQPPNFGGRMLAAMWLTVANLVVAQFVVVRIAADLSHPQGPVSQEIWVPVMYLVWAQVAVNGALLLVPERTRPYGAGVLLGTAGTIVLLVVFFIYVVLPDIS